MRKLLYLPLLILTAVGALALGLHLGNKSIGAQGFATPFVAIPGFNGTTVVFENGLCVTFDGPGTSLNTDPITNVQTRGQALIPGTIRAAAPWSCCGVLLINDAGDVYSFAWGNGETHFRGTLVGVTNTESTTWGQLKAKYLEK